VIAYKIAVCIAVLCWIECPNWLLFWCTRLLVPVRVWFVAVIQVDGTKRYKCSNNDHFEVKRFKVKVACICIFVIFSCDRTSSMFGVINYRFITIDKDVDELWVEKKYAILCIL